MIIEYSTITPELKISNFDKHTFKLLGHLLKYRGCSIYRGDYEAFVSFHDFNDLCYAISYIRRNYEHSAIIEKSVVEQSD